MNQKLGPSSQYDTGASVVLHVSWWRWTRTDFYSNVTNVAFPVSNQSGCEKFERTTDFFYNAYDVHCTHGASVIITVNQALVIIILMSNIKLLWARGSIAHM